MPVISTAMAALGATAFTVGATAVTYGAILKVGAMIALTAASSYMQMQQAKKMKRALSGIGSGDDSVQDNSRATIGAQRIIYGRARVGGQVFFEDTKNPYYTLGLILASHEIDAVERIWINGVEVQLNASGEVITTPFYQNLRSLAKISISLGGDDQAVDPLIAARYPELGANFRQRGHARLVIECNYGSSREENEAAWGGRLPVVQVLVRGKKVYDPSDGSQVLGQPSTYKWTQSPSLACADYLISTTGGRLTTNDIDWAAVAEAAKVDRLATKTLSGVDEPRYTADAVIDTRAETVDSVRGFMTANRGALTYNGDKYRISSGIYTPPAITITLSMLAGSIEFAREAPRKELINIVRTRFIETKGEYAIVDGPVLQRNDYIALDGGEYPATLDMIFVSGASRAQRLAKAYMVDARLGRSLQISVVADATFLEPSDVVRVDIPELMTETLNGEYIVTSTSYNESLTVLHLNLAEYGPEIYEFDPAIDEKPYEG